ncbi:uncharacterized protein BXZ73DRAFT_103287 [Epithele typhae]|uniref:uncharacterized protein n=1 Tax=Epithele typhae TaxID=378194 RepID=UPI002008D4B2|nr:uncharacterized protein BXZ73DRAFT_103287 [Epithele typhae]KAH9925407.1 hypothetical protein BXZ73DRAFT_103287 [Epithele typhae]
MAGIQEVIKIDAHGQSSSSPALSATPVLPLVGPAASQSSVDENQPKPVYPMLVDVQHRLKIANVLDRYKDSLLTGHQTSVQALIQVATKNAQVVQEIIDMVAYISDDSMSIPTSADRLLATIPLWGLKGVENINSDDVAYESSLEPAAGVYLGAIFTACQSFRLNFQNTLRRIDKRITIDTSYDESFHSGDSDDEEQLANSYDSVEGESFSAVLRLDKGDTKGIVNARSVPNVITVASVDRLIKDARMSHQVSEFTPPMFRPPFASATDLEAGLYASGSAVWCDFPYAFEGPPPPPPPARTRSLAATAEIWGSPVSRKSVKVGRRDCLFLDRDLVDDPQDSDYDPANTSSSGVDTDQPVLSTDSKGRQVPSRFLKTKKGRVPYYVLDTLIQVMNEDGITGTPVLTVEMKLGRDPLEQLLNYLREFELELNLHECILVKLHPTEVDDDGNPTLMILSTPDDTRELGRGWYPYDHPFVIATLLEIRDHHARPARYLTVDEIRQWRENNRLFMSVAQHFVGHRQYSTTWD